MDFEGNADRIIESIRIAKAKGASFRTGPELEITYVPRSIYEADCKVDMDVWITFSKMTLMSIRGRCFAESLLTQIVKIFFLTLECMLIGYSSNN
jgi:hypothetical protein